MVPVRPRVHPDRANQAGDRANRTAHKRCGSNDAGQKCEKERFHMVVFQKLMSRDSQASHHSARHAETAAASSLAYGSWGEPPMPFCYQRPSALAVTAAAFNSALA